MSEYKKYKATLLQNAYYMYMHFATYSSKR